MASTERFLHEQRRLGNEGLLNSLEKEMIDLELLVNDLKNLAKLANLDNATILHKVHQLEVKLFKKENVITEEIIRVANTTKHGQGTTSTTVTRQTLTTFKMIPTKHQTNPTRFQTTSTKRQTICTSTQKTTPETQATPTRSQTSGKPLSTLTKAQTTPTSPQTTLTSLTTPTNSQTTPIKRQTTSTPSPTTQTRLQTTSIRPQTTPTQPQTTPTRPQTTQKTPTRPQTTTQTPPPATMLTTTQTLTTPPNYHIPLIKSAQDVVLRAKQFLLHYYGVERKRIEEEIKTIESLISQLGSSNDIPLQYQLEEHVFELTEFLRSHNA